MKSTIIDIGNSRGIRIPKPLLVESGIEKYVNIVVKNGEIRIKSAPKPTEEDNIAKMSESSLSKDWNNKEEDEAWQNL